MHLFAYVRSRRPTGQFPVIVVIVRQGCTRRQATPHASQIILLPRSRSSLRRLHRVFVGRQLPRHFSRRSNRICRDLVLDVLHGKPSARLAYRSWTHRGLIRWPEGGDEVAGDERMTPIGTQKSGSSRGSALAPSRGLRYCEVRPQSPLTITTHCR
jgi:hypothetical protein